MTSKQGDEPKYPDGGVTKSEEASSSTPVGVNGAVQALISVLSNDSNLQRVREHQSTTLKDLRAVRERLTAVNKTSSEQYSGCVTDFLNAARLARQAKEDLNDISKRLALIQSHLDGGQRH